MKTFRNRAAALVALVVAPVGVALADIPASVGTAFTALETDANSLFDTAAPIVISVLSLLVIIKLIKRFGNRI